MHTRLEILIRADSRGEAKDGVDTFLEPYHQQMYDYYAIGGRWEDAKTDEILNVADNLQESFTVISEMINSRIREIKGDYESFKSRIEEKGMSSLKDLVDNPRSQAGSMAGYRLEHIGKNLSGLFNPYIYFYDRTHNYNNLNEDLIEAINNEKNSLWLVTVDMHH